MKKNSGRHSSAVVSPVSGNLSPKWALYDELISLIPEDLVVKEVSIGIHWTMVRSVGLGLSMTQPQGPRSIPNAGSFEDRKLKELAALVKSWHPHEATAAL